MILDYPKIYSNELFYAYILRYHKFSGGYNLAGSIQSFLHKNACPYSVLFIRGIKETLDEIGLPLERYLENHSAVPYYRVFMEKRNYERVSAETLLNSHVTLFRMLPSSRNHLAILNNHLWYCPICHSIKMDYSDIKTYHQLPEVYVCKEHGCYLKKIPLLRTRLLTSPEQWDVSFEMCKDEWLNGVAEDVEYILSEKPDIFLDEFVDAFWARIDSSNVNTNNDWEVKIATELQTLPEEYRPYFTSVRFFRYLMAMYTGKTLEIVHLVIIRIVFGSFKEFVREIRKSRLYICKRQDL